MKQQLKHSAILILIPVIAFMTGYKKAGAAEEKPKLSPEYVSAHQWGEEGVYGVNIKFAPGGTFMATDRYSAQNESTVEGTYKIKGDTLVLTITHTTGLRFKNIKKGLFSVDPTSVRYLYYFQFEEARIWNKDSQRPAAIDMIFDGVTVVTMGAVKGKTTDNVKLRVKPDPSAAEINYIAIEPSPVDPMGTTVEKPFMPRNTAVTVLARTKEKMKVGKWENYWYYVEYLESWDYMKRAWLYGQFLDAGKK
jgi:hypothetical protein